MADELTAGTATASLLAGAAGGGVAIGLSPAMTRREGFIRMYVSMASGFFGTPWIVDLAGIDPTRVQKVLGINAALGFASWVALSVAMYWLESTAAKAKSNGPLWFLNFIRGNVPQPPTPPASPVEKEAGK